MAKISIVFGKDHVVVVDGELERIVEQLSPSHKTPSGMNPIDTDRGKVYVNTDRVLFVRERPRGTASF